MIDAPRDELGQSIGLGYIADGVVRGVARIQANRSLGPSDRHALAQARDFLREASLEPEILSKARLSARSLDHALALETVAKAVTLLPPSLLQREPQGNEMQRVAEFTRMLAETADALLEGRAPSANQMETLRTFFSYVGRLTLDRANRAASLAETEVPWGRFLLPTLPTF